MTNDWKLGPAGHVLSVDALHHLALVRVGWGLVALLAGVLWGGAIAHGAVPVLDWGHLLLPVALGSAVAASRGRATLVLDHEGVRGPSWIPGRVIALPWASITHVSERAQVLSERYVRLTIVGKHTIEVCVDRDRAGEILERIRLRNVAITLPVDDAQTLLELYFDPTRKPVAVVRRDGLWEACDDADELLERVQPSPYRGRARLTAFADPMVLRAVETKYPGLDIDLVPIPWRHP
jgi:hypothetical protein